MTSPEEQRARNIKIQSTVERIERGDTWLRRTFMAWLSVITLLLVVIMFAVLAALGHFSELSQSTKAQAEAAKAQTAQTARVVADQTGQIDDLKKRLVEAGGATDLLVREIDLLGSQLRAAGIQPQLVPIVPPVPGSTASPSTVAPKASSPATTVPRAAVRASTATTARTTPTTVSKPVTTRPKPTTTTTTGPPVCLVVLGQKICI